MPQNENYGTYIEPVVVNPVFANQRIDNKEEVPQAIAVPMNQSNVYPPITTGRMMNVTIPADCSPGVVLTVSAPDGTIVHVSHLDRFFI